MSDPDAIESRKRILRGIQCPACGAEHHVVVDVRQAHGIVHRRRQCKIKDCGRIFTTIETLAWADTSKKTGIVKQMHAALAALSRRLDKI